MPEIFLSYTRDDQATARRFAQAFEREGFSVWWDQTLHSGENYDQVTEGALREAKAVVVLWSAKSVDSRWVRAEATTADRAGTLVPAMIEPCNRPIMFELKHTAELAHWKGDANDPAWKAFVADVRRFVEKGGAVAPAMQSAPPAKRVSGVVIGLAVCLLLVAGIAVWALTRTNMSPNAQGEKPGALSVPNASIAAPEGVSLAVLPFVNLSSDPEQEYFSDGLSEEVLNQLAQVKDLRVTARTSSFSFKGKNEDLRVVGEKLGVGNILEGSVRKSGKRLRITAQLINARDGTHLWSQTYERELNDIFAIQEEIAMAVSQALSVSLGVGDMSRARGGTTNLEAYDKYLRAGKLQDQAGASGLAQAAQLYREAVKLDPEFLRAWRALFYTLGSMVVWTPENPGAIRAERVEVSKKIEALAPDSWWAKDVRFVQYLRERNWAAAHSAATGAMAEAPGSGLSVIGNFAAYLSAVGRIKDTMSIRERAHQSDPLSLSTSVGVQRGLDLASLPVEANAEFERSKTLEGDHGMADFLALQRMWRQHKAPEAVAAQFRRFLENEVPKTSLNALLADKLEDRAAALAAIRAAFQDPANDDTSHSFLIYNYADHFGDRDLALAALRRAYDRGSYDYYNLWFPSESGFRTDPKFKALLRDFGLIDYFRATGNWGDFCKPVGTDDFECH